MKREELLKEIAICEDNIKALSGLMLHNYGTRLKDISKVGIVKDYSKRLENAKKELAKLENKNIKDNLD